MHHAHREGARPEEEGFDGDGGARVSTCISPNPGGRDVAGPQKRATERTHPLRLGAWGKAAGDGARGRRCPGKPGRGDSWPGDEQALTGCHRTAL